MYSNLPTDVMSCKSEEKITKLFLFPPSTTNHRRHQQYVLHGLLISCFYKVLCFVRWCATHCTFIINKRGLMNVRSQKGFPFFIFHCCWVGCVTHFKFLAGGRRWQERKAGRQASMALNQGLCMVFCLLKLLKIP